MNTYEHLDGLVSRGYTFNDVYTMPVRLRNLFVRMAIKKQEDEKKAMDKSRGMTDGPSEGKKEVGKTLPLVPSFVASRVPAKR